MDPVVVYIPKSVQNGLDSLGLKALENSNVGIGINILNVIKFCSTRTACRYMDEMPIRKRDTNRTLLTRSTYHLIV
jgi:hypothetical protein